MRPIDRLTRAFIEGLGISAETDVVKLEYRGIDEWDSVAHMQLITEIETAFDIMLDTEDVIGMSSFTRAREILRKYGIDVEA